MEAAAAHVLENINNNNNTADSVRSWRKHKLSNTHRMLNRN